MTAVDSAEALALLASIGNGRVVFTMRALPAIRVVNHLIDDGEIIIRTRLTATLASIAAPEDTVVAYEADMIDPVDHTGWSVVAIELARPIRDPGRTTRYRGLLHPWMDKAMDAVIGIRPQIVTGFRLPHSP